MVKVALEGRVEAKCGWMSGHGQISQYVVVKWLNSTVCDNMVENVENSLWKERRETRD